MAGTKTFMAICHWGHEIGFRLGGARVATVAGSEEFNELLEQIISEQNVGILAIAADMEEWISEKNKKALARSITPFLARYSYPEKWRMPEAADIYAEQMAFRASGFHFRIKL